MALHHDIASRIRSKALHYFLKRASVGKPIPYEEAETTAAQFIAGQERQRKNKPRPLQHRPANHDEIGLHNAVPLLIDRIMRLAERALADPLPKPKRAPRVPFLKKVKSLENNDFKLSSEINSPAKHPEPLTCDPQLQQMFSPVVSTGTGAQLIPDSEFHSSMFDRTTASWRQSILDNERRAQALEQRRRSQWIG
jgi:hypothetical protein